MTPSEIYWLRRGVNDVKQGDRYVYGRDYRYETSVEYYQRGRRIGASK
jgi:hypothetical protein